MLKFDQMNLRRWGALTCILALSLVLAACGDDDDSNNGMITNNGGLADAGDAGQTDGGPYDVGSDVGGDVGQDGGADADATYDAGDTSDTSDTDEDTSIAAIEVAGDYDSNFGGTEAITSDIWSITYPGSEAIVTTVIEYDNDENFAVTQNPDDAEFDASLFNKNVWTEPAEDGSFYYCTVTYGEETAEAARNTDQTADDTDPANGGCAGFSWTKLTPQ
jgi:hypothetical protein